MDFQSAARFGERRVMVTDYDETAVEVNAKVVDEDTGEVICESGGGGETSDFSTANVTIAVGDNNPEVYFTAYASTANEITGDEIDFPVVSTKEILLTAGNSQTLSVVLYRGNGVITTDKGFQEVIQTTGDISYELTNDFLMIHVAGDGTITIPAA